MGSVPYFNETRYFKDNLFAETGVTYNGIAFSNTLDLATVGTNYYTDMGYVQRLENYDAEKTP